MNDSSDRVDDAGEFPDSGALLGIDFGTKRIGVAVSDRLQSIASPVYNYNRGNLQADEGFFRAVIEEYEAVGFVVGLPVHMSGDESKKSKEARKFAAWLTRRTQLPVALQDERHSSVQAESMLMQASVSDRKRKLKLDKVAAAVILEDYLKSKEDLDESDDALSS